MRFTAFVSVVVAATRSDNLNDVPSMTHTSNNRISNAIAITITNATSSSHSYLQHTFFQYPRPACSLATQSQRASLLPPTSHLKMPHSPSPSRSPSHGFHPFGGRISRRLYHDSSTDLEKVRVVRHLQSRCGQADRFSQLHSEDAYLSYYDVRCA